MDKAQKTRLGWIKLYEEVKDAGVVCRKCGISRPTLRKWSQRYKDQGVDGLEELTRRPLNSLKKSDNRARRNHFIPKE